MEASGLKIRSLIEQRAQGWAQQLVRDRRVVVEAVVEPFGRIQELHQLRVFAGRL
ncbi:hypothetical protein D3C87_2169640 [compost metagenome]